MNVNRYMIGESVISSCNSILQRFIYDVSRRHISFDVVEIKFPVEKCSNNSTTGSYAVTTTWTIPSGQLQVELIGNYQVHLHLLINWKLPGPFTFVN